MFSAIMLALALVTLFFKAIPVTCDIFEFSAMSQTARNLVDAHCGQKDVISDAIIAAKITACFYWFITLSCFAAAV